jgi:predicted transcriptional regulator
MSTASLDFFRRYCQQVSWLNERKQKKKAKNRAAPRYDGDEGLFCITGIV